MALARRGLLAGLVGRAAGAKRGTTRTARTKWLASYAAEVRHGADRKAAAGNTEHDATDTKRDATDTKRDAGDTKHDATDTERDATDTKHDATDTKHDATNAGDAERDATDTAAHSPRLASVS